jgi:hypothetical protein
MKTYCIFKVYDYNGGELRGNVNLSYDSFIGNLAELFENAIYDLEHNKQESRNNKIETIVEDKPYVDVVKEALNKALNDRDFFSTYAGGDGFCGECYEVENNRLRTVSIKNYIDDIAKYIDKTWK